MVEGYINAVKNALITHITEADSSLEGTDQRTSEYLHVLGSWEGNIWDLDYDLLPIVTVRVVTASTHEAIHGRQISPADSKIGTYVTFYFTAHVHHTVPDTGDLADYAMDLAEKIKTKLLKSDDLTSGIKYYREITLRPAPINMNNVARVIVEGYIFVRRPH